MLQWKRKRVFAPLRKNLQIKIGLIIHKKLIMELVLILSYMKCKGIFRNSKISTQRSKKIVMDIKDNVLAPLAKWTISQMGTHVQTNQLSTNTPHTQNLIFSKNYNSSKNPIIPTKIPNQQTKQDRQYIVLRMFDLKPQKKPVDRI